MGLVCRISDCWLPFLPVSSPFPSHAFPKMSWPSGLSDEPPTLENQVANSGVGASFVEREITKQPRVTGISPRGYVFLVAVFFLLASSWTLDAAQLSS